MIHLAKDEQEMLDGNQGRAKQRAMEILVQYGEALGAERLVDTNNVHLLVGFHPYPEVVKVADADEFVSKILLDTEEKVRVDYVKSFNTTHIFAIDMENWRIMNAPEGLHDLMELIRKYCQCTGISLTSTCTPYQVGNLPSRGEHCAWTESSAVPFCNAVLGARTNTETAHSAFSIAITGKIPLSGFHISENRLGTHLIQVDLPMIEVRDWCLLGYYTGEICQLSVPIIDLKLGGIPNLNMLKGFNSAAASSGGIMMYHILEVTPEAPTLEACLKGKKPERVLHFRGEELRQTYRTLNSATDPHIDMVNIGCPHYSLEQLREVARFLDGKKVHGNVTLWIWTAHQLKAMADRNGYTEVIRKAGGQLMIDTCPLNTNLFPQGTKIVATDSAKHAHYAPAIAGVDVWFGRMRECLEASVSGIWKGGLV